MRVIVGVVACAVAGLTCASFAVAESFSDDFSAEASFEDTGSMSESRSPVWWLSSGGRFFETSGVGRTVQGDLPSDDPVREGYARENPVDTDDGYHPQNLFRMITRGTWRDFTQSLRFRVRQVHRSPSEHRNRSNGLFLVARYADQDNLYYLGVRVDGRAVIKKKIAGRYTTLAVAPLFGDPDTYQRRKNPSLLPFDQWLGLKANVAGRPDGRVILRLAVDEGNGWQRIIRAVDDPGSGSGATLSAEGHAGIRSDFMDVEIDDYQVVERE
jgi:hypothetical protein